MKTKTKKIEFKAEKKIEKIEFTTEKQVDFLDVTDRIEEFIESTGIKDGLVNVFSPHTTSSIIINHNEEMLKQDLMRVLYKLIPVDERYAHDMFELTNKTKSDGRSNGHSHCKVMLLGSSESIPLEDGAMLLGEKQSIFFVELDGARKRSFYVQVLGG
ncbi:YjbQ family protein [bacterium]|jgi:secondary thiamine-phosphate synthase enzyme|nr:YjbQ family protein [bacterium]MBT4251450.1 YjbQ family protein [bacterium]MBT4597424.1 YjbQ family protein [bacterium]MBT6754263.1 YjbQ family protein [bacterium]MBT7037589.1 YjbQ family protein [bacterium]